MSSLVTRTLKSLEWHQVTDALTARTKSPLGATRSAQHQPFHTAAASLHMHRRVSECIKLLQVQPAFHSLLKDTEDPRSYFDRACREGVLEAHDVYVCGYFMASLGLVSQSLQHEEENAPCLKKDFEAAPKVPPLWEQIQKSVTSDGQILDTASPELGRLRQQRYQKRIHFEKLIQSQIKDWHKKGFLQDSFYDVFDGRYVVPVRIDQQSKLTGNLYSRSHSGQSLYVEPSEFATPNNELQEIEIKIHTEERRILRDLSLQIADHAPTLEYWVEPLQWLDVYFAAAVLARDWELTEPQTPVTPTLTLQLIDVFHPLLKASGVHTVTNSIYLSQQDGIALIISGPNTGGKTVLLKAVALTALMAQAGLFVPAAQGSVIPHYTHIFALIGDDQSITEGLSSFSAQIKDLREILTTQGRPFLIVIDEVLSSTDPEEATALAQSLLEDFTSNQHHTLITTHFSELANRCRHQTLMSVGAMEFQEGHPTYRFRPQELGASHALDVATQLGLPPRLIQRAQHLLSQDKRDYNRALQMLKDKEKRLEHTYQQQIEKLEQDFREKQKNLETERQTLKERYDRFVAEAQRKIEAGLENIRTRMMSLARQGHATKEQAIARIEKTAQTILDEIQHSASEEKGTPKTPLTPAVGMLVRVLSMGRASGVILELHDSVDEATVQVGSFKVRKPLRDLVLEALAPSPLQRVYSPYATTATEADDRIGNTGTLDLRGHRYEDAMAELEHFLDQAFRSGFPRVTIITGHGTGALKKGLKDLVVRLPYVKSSHPERPHDDGAMVIEFDI